MPRSPSATGPSPERQRRFRTGLRAETLAALFLRLKLYRIVAQRVRLLGGEIDIVALHGRTLVFVEVKARPRRSDFGQAMEAVNQRRIAQAANAYVGRHQRLAGLDQRFDVIFLAPFSWPRHVTNAFEAS